MPCCLFCGHLAFQLDPKPFKRVIAFWFFFAISHARGRLIDSLFTYQYRSTQDDFHSADPSSIQTPVTYELS